MPFGQFTGGAAIASGNLDGDAATAELVAAAGSGGGPHVRVFTGMGTVQNQFFAYGTGFRGGIDVAAAAATETSSAFIVTGAGPGGGPHVRLFTPTGEVIGQFFAGETKFRGGVRVSVGETQSSIDGPEIYTVPQQGGSPSVGVYGLGGTRFFGFRAYEEWWTGGFDVAASAGSVWISTARGGRRASVRPVIQTEQPDPGFFDEFEDFGFRLTRRARIYPWFESQPATSAQE